MSSSTPFNFESVQVFPKAGDEVERINQFDWYTLGQQLAEARALPSEDTPISKCFWALWTARELLDDLLGGKPAPLGISKRKAQDARNQFDKAINDYGTEVGEDGKRRWNWSDSEKIVPAYIVRFLTDALHSFETVFAEEMREDATYRVPPRGIYSIAKLVDAADEAFPTDIAVHVPEKTKADWRSSGRCLAFNLLTASGFHAARGVEGMLEIYYQHFTGKTGTLNGWKDYVDALTKVRPASADEAPFEKTITAIDQMRLFSRNPLMHPRIVLEEAEARMLFANCESLIIAMAHEVATSVAASAPSTAKPKRNAASSFASGGSQS